MKRTSKGLGWSSLIEDVSSRPDFIRWYQLLMDISKKLQSKLIQGETK